MGRGYPVGGPQQVSAQDVEGVLYNRSKRQRRRMLEAEQRRREKKARRKGMKNDDGQQSD